MTKTTARLPLALIFVGALLVGRADGRATQGAEKDPVQTVDAFHAALVGGEADKAAELLDDKALIYEEGDAEASKQQYAEHHLPADIAFLKTMHETITKRSHDTAATLAWVATEGRMVGRYKDKDIDRTTTESMVLRRTAGGWRIVHIHWSSKATSGK